MLVLRTVGPTVCQFATLNIHHNLVYSYESNEYEYAGLIRLLTPHAYIIVRIRIRIRIIIVGWGHRHLALSIGTIIAPREIHEAVFMSHTSRS
jgi:hypothetical protein